VSLAESDVFQCDPAHVANVKACQGYCTARPGCGAIGRIAGRRDSQAPQAAPHTLPHLARLAETEYHSLPPKYSLDAAKMRATALR
jgi:hypothetical protein